MGSAGYFNVVEGLDVSDLYSDLRADARYQYGNGGYSGTIGESDGYRVLTHTPVTMAQAQALYEKADEEGELDKWGPAHAVPVFKHTPVKRGPYETFTVEAKFTGKQWGTAIHDEGRAEVVAKLLKIKPTDVEQVMPYNHDSVQVKMKTAAKATEGGKVTKFFVVAQDTQTMPKWENGYESQAAARAAINDYPATDYRGGESVTYEVISMTRRESGEGLVVGQNEIVSVSGTVNVSVRREITPESNGTDHWGWVFFGNAPC